MNTRRASLALSIVVLIFAEFGAAADTSITFQGRLQSNGINVSNICDFRFRLYDAGIGGIQAGATISVANVLVSEGLFTVELDFGAEVFDEPDRWLEIDLRCPAGDGNYTTMSPRQRVTSAPYSVQTRGLFVNNSLNVGIGTSAPAYPLNVETDTSNRGIYILNSTFGGVPYGLWSETTSTTGGIGVYGYASATNGFNTGVQGRSNSSTGTGVTGFASANSGLNFGVLGETNSPQGYGGYFLGRGYFSDRLGVGTNSPSRVLHTFGDAVMFERAVNDAAVILRNTSNGLINTQLGLKSTALNDGYAYLTDQNTNPVVYLKSQKVGIGVATPNNKLQVETDSIVDNAILGYNASGSAITGISVGGAGVHGTSEADVGVRGDSTCPTGTGVFGRASSGIGINYGVNGRSNSPVGFDFYASGAGINYGASSSIRWKENIKRIDDPLTKLVQLRGVYFDWDSEHGGHHDVGMIAEEVGKILPEIVAFEKNGIDADGMDYSKLSPLLVEGVKALREKDSQLETQITRKDRQINELTRRLANLESLLLEVIDNQQSDMQCRNFQSQKSTETKK